MSAIIRAAAELARLSYDVDDPRGDSMRSTAADAAREHKMMNDVIRAALAWRMALGEGEELVRLQRLRTAVDVLRRSN